jgi:uncharacterized protein involved in exopolysaccharide biosynthesis
MEQDALITQEGSYQLGPSVRDIVSAGFRHRRAGVVTFICALILLLAFAFVGPRTYHSDIKILVKTGRVDPVVTAEQQQPVNLGPENVTEEQLNSEVELLKSEDVLRKVVVAAGLQHRSSWLDPWLGRGNASEEEKIERAASRLRRDLSAEPLRKSNIIDVEYRSPDPEISAKVLNTLGDAYLEKHLEVHRVPGQFKFFDEQAAHYQQELGAAEEQLRQGETVPPQVMLDSTLQKLNDFKATHAQALATIRETERRISELQKEEVSIPARITTQERKADNGQLMQQLKGSLATLELKRVELLAKYQPTYRPVQELEQQIAQTRDAIAREQSAPLQDVTSDQNPAHIWVGSELAKSEADLVGMRARATALEKIIDEFGTNASQLNRREISYEDLQRAAKTAEDNYMLYVRRREEARITEALDKNRILNVTVAQRAFAPRIPAGSPWKLAAMGLLLAAFASIGVVVAAEYFDTSYRTPSDVVAYLNVPVLAALPLER